MNLFDATVPQLAKALRNLDTWMIAAEKHAESAKYPVDNLIYARLAPDAFTFVRQVQTVCDNAKFVPGRLAAREWPTHADTETTFAQLHERIAATQQFLATFERAQLDGADERKIALPWMQSTWMTGAEYLIEFGMPNFYFHLSTAYQLLRHNGIPLGKRDFIGSIPMRT
jgi:uncharacterized protein